MYISCFRIHFIFLSFFFLSLYGANDPYDQIRLEKFQSIIQGYEKELKENPHNLRLALALGDAYYSLKDYPQAIAMYKIALADKPEDLDTKLLLANAYLANFDKDNSKRLYQEVYTQNPRSVDAIVGLGRLEALRYNFRNAENYYNLAYSINATDPTLLYYLADLKIDLKQFAEAKTILEGLKKENPKFAWITKALDRAQDGPNLDKLSKLEESGDYKEAIARYEKEIETHKDSIDFYLGLARLYTLSKQPTQAISLLTQAMNIDPTSSALNLAMGHAYLANGNFSEAKKYYELALSKSINNAEPLTSLGKLYLSLGDEQTAESYYKIALKDNPESIVALSSLASLSLKQNKIPEAAKLYENILVKDPKSTWAISALDGINFDSLLKKLQEKPSSKENEDAVKAFMNKTSPLPEYYIKLGLFYMMRNELQKAVNLYLEGIKALPKSLDLQLALGNAYLKRGDYPAATGIFEDVLTEKKESTEAISGLGKLAELQGRQEDAMKNYNRALHINPSDLTALNYLSSLFIQQRKFEEAKPILEKIKQVDPTAKWVDNALIELKHGEILADIKEKIKEKDIKGAIALYDQLLLQEPKNPSFYLRAALFSHHEKKYDKAVETYLKGIKIAPDNAALYSGLGFSYVSQKKYGAAFKAFTAALKLDSDNPDALAGMGSFYTNKKKFKKADDYISKSLELSPENDAALSSLGNLRMLQKQYPQAAEAYQKLLKEKPDEKWIRLLYENALNGTALNEIQELIKDEKFEEAASRYKLLSEKYPSNPLYSSGEGLMYLRLKKYQNATDVYLKALKTSPEENELLVSLGYSYLLAKNWDEAKPVLEKALKEDPKDAEAIAGLGRITFNENDEYGAEELYKKALDIKPENESALNFYAILLMKQKRFHEAEAIISRLHNKLPKEAWIDRYLKDAQDGPITEIAKQFSDDEEFEAAAILYTQLIDSSPTDPARYEALGEMYVNLYDYYSGIEVYEQGLEVDPDAFYLWRSIAFAYIYLEEYDIAYCIFTSILEDNPDDAESIAGLGRIEALIGSWYLAEQYYLYALSLSPENQTILGFYADLKKTQGYYCSAYAFYDQLMQVNDRPKWIRTAYQDILNKTMPTITLQAGSHEERQWDPSLHRFSAKYQVQGAGALITYLLCDDLTLTGRMYDEYFQLKDLITRDIIYSVDAERGYLGLKCLYQTHWTFDFQLGLTNSSRYRHGTFDVTQQSIFEPGIRVTFQQPQEKASLAFWSDSLLVARNFEKNTSKLFGRYFLNANYEKQVYKRTWLGFDANASIYDDYVTNSSVNALGWFQWRPSIYTNNFLFRYHVKYGAFSKNIPDYYTYKAQWVNYFQATLEKYWRVWWADSFYTSLSFGHGFQNTLTKFSQIIVLAPNLTNKLAWDNRQYNIAIVKGIYKRDQLQISLVLDYYRDTEKYTMSSILGELTWRF